MSNTIVNTVEYPKKIQQNLKSALVADAISTAMFGNVAPKQQIVFPYMNDPRVQTYSYSGTNTVDDTVMTTDGYTIDQVKTSTGNYDPVQNNLFQDMSWQDKLANQMGYQLARNIDQYVLNTGINGAYTTMAAGTVGTGNILQIFTAADAYMTESEAFAGDRYLVMDAFTLNYLPQMDVAGGFTRADRALVSGINGYVGSTSAGLKVFQSNNLPYSTVVTLSVIPVAGTTFTIKGVVFTAAANGAASAAGEFSISTTAALAQANLRAAINGTGTPGASTYIEVSTPNRRILQNSQTSCSAFSSDVATITSYGRQGISTTIASAVIGTETFSMLAGVMGAIDCTILRQPYVEELSVSSVGAANHSKNLIATTLFGAGVYHLRKRGLVKITANATVPTF